MHAQGDPPPQPRPCPKPLGRVNPRPPQVARCGQGVGRHIQAAASARPSPLWAPRPSRKIRLEGPPPRRQRKGRVGGGGGPGRAPAAWPVRLRFLWRPPCRNPRPRAQCGRRASIGEHRGKCDQRGTPPEATMSHGDEGIRMTSKRSPRQVSAGGIPPQVGGEVGGTSPAEPGGLKPNRTGRQNRWGRTLGDHRK